MSLIHTCKRKLDDYAPDDDGAGFSSSVILRSDVNISANSFSGARSAAESSKSNSNSSLQFLVRLFSGMQTLVIRADVDDTVEYVHVLIRRKTNIPVNEQLLTYKSKQLYPEQTLGECCVENDAVLQLVGVMRSTPNAKAQQSVDEIVSLIRRLCKGNSENESWDSEARRVIRTKLSDYFSEFLPNESERTIAHLQIFSSSGAPAALAMLYMSPDISKSTYGGELIHNLTTWISFLPQNFCQQCVPILVEICKSLRGMPGYANDIMFNMCRGYLCNMVGCIKVGSTDPISLNDMRTFVEEAVGKLVSIMHSGIQLHTRMSPSHPLATEVLYLKTFLTLTIRFIAQERFHGCQYTMVSRYGPYILTIKSEFTLISEALFRLLGKMDECLEGVERLLPTRSEYLGCYPYLAIIMELSKMSKLFPDLKAELWTTLTNRKLAFRYLIMKYARRGDDYGWISEHKEVTNFECRRHLAMMLFPQVSDEDEYLMLDMLIERSRLLEESFEYIAHANAYSLRAGLFLEFKDEDATGPGVLREWFVLVCQAIFDPRNALFVACPNDRRRFFLNPASKVDPLHLEYFKFAGRVIALALIHKVQVGIVFDRVLFLQLAERDVSLEDIRDADPVLYSSCKRILEMDPEEVDQDSLALTFSVETDDLGSRNVVELCPDGKNIVVNSTNRENYVAQLLQYHFVDSVKDQVAQFAQGFDDIINSGRLRKSFFQFLELEDFDGLLYGSEKALSVDDWMAHTDYDGYKETDPQISWFWETVRSMSAGQRKALLFFWTSLKNLPVEGFGGLNSRLYISKVNETCNRLPSSHTCFYQLCFPPYQSLEVMKDRLSLITQEHVGCSFGTY